MATLRWHTSRQNSTKIEVASGSTPDLVGAGTGFTVLTLWYCNSLDQRFCRLWHSKTSSNARIQCNLGDNNGYIEFQPRYSTTHGHVRTVNNTLVAGNWFWIACVDNGAGVNPQIFTAGIDGIFTEASYSSQTAPAGTIQNASGNPWTLGNTENTNRGPTGRFGAHFVYSTAINDPEALTAIANSPHMSAIEREHLELAWFPGINGTSGTCPDFSGNGRDGTLSGSTFALVEGIWSLQRPLGFAGAALALAASGVTYEVPVAIDATSTVAVTPSRIRTAQVAIDATSTVAVTPSVIRTSQVAIDATSTVAVTPSRIRTAQVAIDATSTVAVVGTKSSVKTATVTVGATSTVAATSQAIKLRQVAIDATSTVAVTPSVIRTSQVAIDTTSAVTVAAQAIKPRQVAIDATSDASITPTVSGVENAVVVIDATSTVAVTPQGIKPRQVAIDATSAVTAAPGRIRSVTVSMGATSSVTVSVAGVKTATVAIDSVSIFTGTGVAIRPAQVVIAGSSVVTIVGASVTPVQNRRVNAPDDNGVNGVKRADVANSVSIARPTNSGVLIA